MGRFYLLWGNFRKVTYLLADILVSVSFTFKPLVSLIFLFSSILTKVTDGERKM